MNQWTIQTLNRLLKAPDFHSQLDCLAELSRGLGFTFYAFSCTTSTCLISHDNLPHQWAQRYRSKGYAAVDPIPAHCQRSSFPLLWNAHAFATAPELRHDMQAHGLCHGWTQPFHDTLGNASSLSLLRAEPAVSLQELYAKITAVLWVTQALHHSACLPTTH